MCLDKLTKVYEEPDKKKIIGYKVIYSYESLDGKHYKSTIFPHAYYSQIMDNIDVAIGNIDDTMDGSVIYPTGFHAFKSEEDAEKWKASCDSVWKVECTDIVAEGTQDAIYEGQKHTLDVLVCRKFSFLEEV